jgi:transcriptional regulator with XRE-family HTH domain
VQVLFAMLAAPTDTPNAADAPAPSPEAASGSLARRVKARMEELRLDNAAVVAASGLSKAMVYRILRDEKKNLDFDTAARLAQALSWDVATLQGLASDAAPRQATPVTMLEPADVRIYREPPESGEQAPQVRHDLSPPVPTDPRLRNRPVRAVPVTNNQMMAMTPPVPPGYIAFIAAGDGLPLETGAVYLVSRPDSEGKIQTAFRRLTVYPDFYEFAVLSPEPALNARHRLVVSKDDLATGQVKIDGIFFGATFVV